MTYRYRKKKSPIDYKIVVVIVLLAVLVAVVYSLNIQPEEVPTPYCGDGICQSTESCSSCPLDCGECPPPTPSVTFKGELVIAVRDVKHKLTGGYILTGLNLTVNSIQVHKTGTNETDENVTAKGWITVFNGTKTLDLVDYSEDIIALLGEKELEPGKYTQIRLYISEAYVKMYNSNMSVWNKSYEAKVPSKVLKLTHPFTIEENKTLILTLDFDVYNSLCKGTLCRRSGAPGEQWVFRPTLKTNVGPLNDGVLEETLEKGKRPEKAVEIPED